LSTPTTVQAAEHQEKSLLLQVTIREPYMPGMRNATLRQLQIFVAAADSLSFSRASAQLHLTQPAISMQMRQLENRAGLPLFDRLGKRLQLTQAGAELLGYARTALRALKEADDAFAALRGLKGGKLSIGVVSTAKYFAPRLLAQFARGSPEIELRLSVNNRDAVVRQLEANEIDIAVMGQPPAHLQARATAFARHPLSIIAAPDHPLAGRKRVPLRALERETFLMREPGSGTRSAMESFFRGQGVRVRAGMEMSSNETIKQAVMAGMGVAFISEHTIGLERSAGQLCVLRVEGLPVLRRWFVVHLQAKRLSPAAAAFEQFMLEQGSALMKLWPQG
jgi:DNA-binding transcriptional LysR family regulator